MNRKTLLAALVSVALGAAAGTPHWNGGRNVPVHKIALLDADGEKVVPPCGENSSGHAEELYQISRLACRRYNAPPGLGRGQNHAPRLPVRRDSGAVTGLYGRGFQAFSGDSPHSFLIWLMAYNGMLIIVCGQLPRDFPDVR